ncbi:MAG: YitT family protein [Bacteroidales bacterium]|nr:YitT family protein [Bacteroidales bacterium]MDD4671181.1 YitT family protein [Bacteroidales bacterium]
MQKQSVYKEIRSYLIMTIGMLLYCFSWTGFLIPKGIAGGGATGLATVIYFASGIPVPYMYLGINLVLLIVGTMILGKGFGFKTIYCIIMATLMLEFLPMLPWVTDIEDKLINAVIGGTISGVGISLVFMNGGSAGGTDIVAIVIAKYKETSPGRVFLFCDLIIIGSIIFLPGKTLQDVIYGYIQMVSFSYILDTILTGNKQSVQILVFSSKYEEIANMLTQNMHRGVTALNSIGWYSQKDGKVLVIVARKNQLQEISRAIKEVDDTSFISVTQAMSVYGKGFEQIKTGVNKNEWKKVLKKSSQQ